MEEEHLMNVVLNKKKCSVKFEHYADNNNVAILLVRKKRGSKEEELVATATVNTDVQIKQEFVIIKNWSENNDIEQALIDAEVICSQAVGAIRCGMAVAYIYELTPKAKDWKNNL